MANSYKELKEGIQSYQSNRKEIISISLEIIKLFKDVSDHLSEDVLKSFNTEILIDSLREFGVVNLNANDEEMQNPAIAIIGAVKAGKSFFVNNLLRKSVVPDSYSRCTARLIRLHYSKKNYLNVVNSLGIVEKYKSLRRRIVPEKYVKLSEDERKMKSKVDSIVNVGLNISFLKCGIDLIDSPGFGENSALTNVSMNVIKSVLPIIIYVIDGRTSLKQSDIADLIELKSKNPNLEIFYFITKLDTDNIEQHDLNDPIAIAKYKMDFAFSKLQRNNLIPDSIKQWSDCSHFHGASLIRRMQYLNKRINPETIYHNQLFSRFEASLSISLLDYFRNKIDTACDIVIGFIMTILAKIIHHAQYFANKVHENLAHISEIKRLEEELYEKIKQAITCSKEDLMDRLIKRLTQDTDKIIDPIKEAEYPLSISIPEDGIVTDPLIIEQCQDNIRMILVQGLENVIANFVEEELFKKYKLAVENKFFSDITAKFPQQQNSNRGKSPYQILLEKILDQNYKIEKLSSCSEEGCKNTTVEFMNVILASLKDFLSNIFPQILKDSDAEVKNPTWKLRQAQELLQKMNIHLLAEDVCKRLIEDFDMKHKSFLDALESERLFIQQEIIIINDIRFRVIGSAPEFFEKLINAVAIMGNYQYSGVQDLKENVCVDNVTIYRSSYNNQIIRRKEVRLDGKDKEEIRLIRERLSEEVYYSLLLSHHRILRVLGVTMNENKNIISIYYPYMKSNLEKFIDDNFLSQKDKLTIAYQVAEGLKYLHDHDIMHRNLMLENILVDESNNVFLSDFGFKSEALIRSLDSFPDHVAPEIIYKRIYCKSTDIYPFGKMIVFLLKGKRKHERQSVGSDKMKNIMDKIAKDMIKLLPDVPINISNMIINCCKTQPDDRPDIDTILSVLHDYVKK